MDILELGELKELKAHIDARLDRIEGKMDNHLDRISQVEVETAKQQAEISWVKGSMRLGITILLTLIGSILSLYMKYR